AERATTPIVLRSQRKLFTADGGHRTITPEQTVAEYGHHVSPITGAVSHLVPTPVDGQATIHVYSAGHNVARYADNLHSLRRGLRSENAGKGATDAQARASGLCEALERYSGIFRGDEPRLQASFRELGEQAVHANACMLFSELQYQRRDAWNERGSRFNYVPHA